MLKELGSYYQGKLISAEGFRCSNRDACQAACHGDLIEAKSAFVGSAYEAGALPRILFVSLDPGESDKDWRKRTPDYVRWWEENGGCDPEKLDGRRHWYWTHKFAHEILNPVSVAKGQGAIEFRDIHRYFAHTNSAKCKDPARGKRQGDKKLFENCREFIRGEMEILRPDLVITQGKFARQAVDGQFPVTSEGRHPQYPDYSYQLLSVSSRPVLTFYTSHPANYGKFAKERREAHSWYFERARTFLLEGQESVQSASGGG